MKKNILAIAILAAVIANIILTAVLIFSIVPANKKSVQLMDNILKCIDLELENPDASDYAEVPLSAREPVVMGSDLTVNLKRTDADKSTPFAQIKTFTIVFNTESEAYKEVSTIYEKQASVINNYAVSLVSEYTKNDVLENKEKIEKDVITYCKTYFKSQDVVVDVVLDIIIP